MPSLLCSYLTSSVIAYHPFAFEILMRAPTVWPVLSSMLETFASEEVQGSAQKRRLLQVLFAREKGSVCEQ